MAKLRLRLSISLDGFVAGPAQSIENPLGKGGMGLHDWLFVLKDFRALHQMEGGEENLSSQIFRETFDNIGATIMGRNMFGGHPGDWKTSNPWNGWWGENPPFHHSVFVLTHFPRSPLKLEGENVFYFVTEGIESALERARDAAQGKDVALGGGAKAAQQYLRAGLVDEMILSLVPILLGSGERLFENLNESLFGLSLKETVVAPGVIHLKFRRA